MTPRELLSNPIYRLDFTLDGLPQITANGSHGHWMVVAKAKRKWIQLTGLAIGPNKPAEPLKRAKCTFIRASSAQPDDDNLRISFKPIRDGLVVHGVLVNDKPENIPDPVYRWERAPMRKGFVRVIVEEIA